MEINNTVLALPTMNSFIKLLLNVIPCGLLIPPFSQNIKIIHLQNIKILPLQNIEIFHLQNIKILHLQNIKILHLQI
jgi:hypothetical protein